MKIRSLAEDLQTQSAVAELLGVSRSQVTRWLRGAGIDPLNAERVDLLELVLVEPLPALRARGGPRLAVRPQSAPRRPPADRPRAYGPDRGAAGGDPRRARGIVRVILWRCFAWDGEAAPGEPGRARLVSAGVAGRAAGTTTPTSTAASTSPTARRPGSSSSWRGFAGIGRCRRSSSAAAWRSRSRGSSSTTPSARWISTTRRELARRRLRPSRVATRQRELTQPQALAAYADGADALSWWSSHESLWTNVTVFDRAAPSLRVTDVRVIRFGDAALAEAAESSAWRPDVVRGGRLSRRKLGGSSGSSLRRSRSRRRVATGGRAGRRGRSRRRSPRSGRSAARRWSRRR